MSNNLAKKRRTLKKHLKENKKTEKVSKSMHLVAGKHEHNITHSIAPISASEIEKIEAINPEYVNRLFNIVEKSLDLEKQEMEKYFEAIDHEQQNDELEIIAKNERTIKSLQYATGLTVFLIIVSLIFAFKGQEGIAVAIVTVLLVSIIKGIFSKNKDKDTKDK